MKKTLGLLVLIAGLIALASTSAFAAPVIDGSIGAHPGAGANEWVNLNDPAATSYPYYLEILDPTGDAVADSVDLTRAVLLQELSACAIPASCGAFGSGDGDTTNDGIYLLIETVAAPTMDPLNAPTGPYDTVFPEVQLAGDLLGDGLGDGFNIFLRHSKKVDGVTEVVRACVGSALTCAIEANYVDLTGIGGAWARGSVLEYYIPSGALGTPTSPPGTQFPYNFEGSITYDNGLANQAIGDDFAFGTLPVIPEPSTAVMFGVAMLGLAGLKKRFS